ncbi:MAG: TonB-dependent receptor [Opitutaceae bacterium]|jgi:TonB-dependent receptor|nr:TonB-dependent receptor [Opitutaceae bacterium]
MGKKFLFRLIVMMLLCSAFSLGHAQNASTPDAASTAAPDAAPSAPDAAAPASSERGAIEGRVYNPDTRRYLNNALVSIPALGVSTVTDQDGNFRLGGVPPGRQLIQVEYEELNPVSATVTVPAGQTVIRDLEMKLSIVQLEAFTVSADREGQAAATQAQRMAVEGLYIMSADNFGNVQDGNIGELLKQLPGISVETLTTAGGGPIGEPGSISIRGSDVAAMVTLDGNAQASTSLNGDPDRAFTLRGINTDMIDSIEVARAPTPAHPGNSLGGVVNFTTRSAFQQKGRRASLDVQLKLLAEEWGVGNHYKGNTSPSRILYPALSFSYSEAFFQDTAHPFGVNFTFRTNRVGRTGVRSSIGPSTTPALPFGQENSPDYPVASRQLTWDQEDWVTDTRDVSLMIDYKVSPATTAYIKLSAGDGGSIDGGLRQVFINAMPALQEEGSSDTLMIVPENYSHSLQARNYNYRYSSDRIGINPGMKHKWGSFSLSYDVFYNRSRMDRNEKAVTYMLNPQSTDSGHRISYTVTNWKDMGNSKLVVDEGSTDPGELENWGYLQLQNSPMKDYDKKYGGKIDVKQGLLFHFPLLLQAGAAFTASDRYSSRATEYYQFTGKDMVLGSPDDPSLGQFADYGQSNHFYWMGHVPSVPWVNPDVMYAYQQANPELFPMPTTVNNFPPFVNDKWMREDVTAIYFMGTWKLGDLSVLAGARWELTKGSVKGYVRNVNLGAPTNETYAPDSYDSFYARFYTDSRTKVYENWLPALHLRYEPVKKLQFRGSVTKSIGRPPIRDLLPGFSGAQYDVNTQYMTIRMPNPDLLPEEGTNFDASVDYYYHKSGYVTFSVFKKARKNQINTAPQIAVGSGPDNGFGGLYEGYFITRQENRSRVILQGFELSGMHSLPFLPWKLKNLRVTWNYSKSEGKTEMYPGAGWVDRVDGQYDGTANLGLFYNGRRFAWNARGNYQGKRTQNTAYWVGTNIMSGQNVVKARTTVDVSLTYKLTARWRFYCDVRNVTRADIIVEARDGFSGTLQNAYTNVTFGISGNY